MPAKEKTSKMIDFIRNFPYSLVISPENLQSSKKSLPEVDTKGYLSKNQVEYSNFVAALSDDYLGDASYHKYNSNMESDYRLPAASCYATFRENIRSEKLKETWELFVYGVNGVFDLMKMARLARQDEKTFLSIIENDVVKIACLSNLSENVYSHWKNDSPYIFEKMCREFAGGLFDIVNIDSLDQSSEYVKNLKAKTWLLACKAAIINPINPVSLPNICQIDASFANIKSCRTFEIDNQSSEIKMNGKLWLQNAEVEKSLDQGCLKTLNSAEFAKTLIEVKSKSISFSIKDKSQHLNLINYSGFTSSGPFGG